MGLGIAEFVIAVEEAFQVDILERDAQRIDTLEELIVYLERKTADTPHSQDEADRVFQEGFLSLQRLFAAELGIEASQLNPETEIAPLLKPLSKRRRIWKKIKKDAPRCPSLYGKIYIEWIGGLCVFLGFFFGLFVTIGWDNNAPLIIRGMIGLMSGAIGGFLLFFMGLVLFSPLFSTIPKECRTLGGLAKCTCTIVLGISLDPNGQAWNRESIEKEVLRMASASTRIPVEEISLTEKLAHLF